MAGLLPDTTYYQKIEDRSAQRTTRRLSRNVARKWYLSKKPLSAAKKGLCKHLDDHFHSTKRRKIRQGKVAWGWITKKTYARAIFSRRGRAAIIGAFSKIRAQPGPSRTKSSHSSILGMDTRETCFYFLFIDNSEYKPYSGTRVFLITNTNLNKRFFGEILN